MPVPAPVSLDIRANLVADLKSGPFMGLTPRLKIRMRTQSDLCPMPMEAGVNGKKFLVRRNFDLLDLCAERVGDM